MDDGVPSNLVMDIQAVCSLRGTGRLFPPPWLEDRRHEVVHFQLLGFFQFFVSLFEYFLLSVVKEVHRRDITDGAVQPEVVVMMDEPSLRVCGSAVVMLLSHGLSFVHNDLS